MMTNYKGIDKDFNYRIAEINFNENEEKKLERIAFIMNIKGWQIDIVTNGYALCEIDNFEEYKNFMKDWKECKRTITNCIRYGF